MIGILLEILDQADRYINQQEQTVQAQLIQLTEELGQIDELLTNRN